MSTPEPQLYGWFDSNWFDSNWFDTDETPAHRTGHSEGVPVDYQDEMKPRAGRPYSDALSRTSTDGLDDAGGSFWGEP